MKYKSRLILLLAIARFVLPYLLQSPAYEPHRDEFLYLAEGHHLAWGFLEVPPLISFFAWLTHLLGSSMFWIKFWPNLFGSLTFIICARIATQLGGGRFSIWLLFLAFIFGAWLRMFFLFQPNAPEIFFSGLMCYGIFRFLEKDQNKYLYIFGVAIGFGLLTKYTIAFWFVSLIAGLLICGEWRIFRNKHFFYSLAVAFLIFLPNLLWQVVHRFPVFHHMVELKSSQLNYISTADFLMGELLMYIAVFFVWIAGLIFVFSQRGRKYRALGIAFLLLQSTMILLHGKSYYTAGSFTILFSLGAVYLEQKTKSNFWKYPVIIFPLIAGLLIWPVLLPVASPARLSAFYQNWGIARTGSLTWEDQKTHPLPQDFADMLGWQEMTEKVAAAYHTLSPEEKNDAIVWCDNYGEAGAINFYRRKYGLPQAYSVNGSFLFWLPPTRFPDNVILVSDNNEYKSDPYIQQFGTVKVTDSIVNPFAREFDSRVLILKNPSGKFKELFQHRIDSIRNQFGSRK